MHQRADLAEGEEIVARLEPQNVEHRVGPEDAAARQVPIPQAAAPAVERGVDPAAHGVEDEVGFAGAQRLPVKREAQDQQHEAGGGEQRDREHGVGPPRRQRGRARLDDEELPERGFERAQREQHRGAVRQGDFRGAGADARRRRAPVAQDLGDVLGQVPAQRGYCRDQVSGGIAEQDVALRPIGLRWDGAGKLAQGALDEFAGPIRALDLVYGDVGDRVDVLERGEDRLAMAVVDLNDRADPDRHQKGDDQRGHRPSQGRLGGEQPPVCRFGDRLGQSLDGIRTYRRVRCFGARHSGLPMSPSAAIGSMCRISPNHFHWNRNVAICRESASDLFAAPQHRSTEDERQKTGAGRGWVILCPSFARRRPSSG